MVKQEQSVFLGDFIKTGLEITRERDVNDLIPEVVTGFSKVKYVEKDLLSEDPKVLVTDLEFDQATKHEKVLIVTELDEPVIAVVEQSRGLNLKERLVVNLYPLNGRVEVPYLAEEGGPYGYKELTNDLGSQLVIPDSARLAVAKRQNQDNTTSFIVSVDQGV